MNNFIYDVPTKIYFGENAVDNLNTEIKNYGKHVLLCYGGGSIKKSCLYDTVIAQLKKAQVRFNDVCEKEDIKNTVLGYLNIK